VRIAPSAHSLLVLVALDISWSFLVLLCRDDLTVRGAVAGSKRGNP
jgi:hypothetical protein